jgi:GNAT superfamily N-acetyltransferase
VSALRVRAATAADVPTLWRMALGLADYERMLGDFTGSAEALADALFGPRPLLHALLAELGDAPVGYALVYETFSSFRCVRGLWLEDLFVEPHARGTGAGHALLRAVAREALARGCGRVQWHVLDWNQLAIDFYQAHGAREPPVDWLTYGLDAEGLAALAAE